MEQLSSIDALMDDAMRRGNVHQVLKEQLLLKAIAENRILALKKKLDDISHMISTTGGKQHAPAGRPPASVAQSSTAPLPLKCVLATDGACSGNPGPGGWAYILQVGEQEHPPASGFAANTTNNIMELTALIRGLQKCQELGSRKVEVLLDSRYVMDGATKWIKGWKSNGWITASKTPVLNKDLWMQLDSLMGPHISLQWVKGHGHCAMHNRADALARAAIRAPSS